MIVETAISMAKAFLIDMDGVLVRGAQLIPGAEAFVERLNAEGYPYFIFTNNSRYTPAMLSERLMEDGLGSVRRAHLLLGHSDRHFFGSSAGGGQRLRGRRTGPRGCALDEVGYRRNDVDPDVVILGEPIAFDFDAVTRALQLVHQRARVSSRPTRMWPTPGRAASSRPCGAIAAMISAATGVQPYAIGKPNPLMMRCALNRLGARAPETVIIGDRMDTDIVAGMESGLETVLVLSGVTRPRRRGPLFLSARSHPRVAAGFGRRRVVLDVKASRRCLGQCRCWRDSVLKSRRRQ